MIQYYKTIDFKLQQVSEIENDVWINITAPTENELKTVTDSLDIDSSFIKSLLDEEESSHIEIDENQILIIIDVPIMEQKDDKTYMYSTIPLGIVVLPKNIVTVCLKENDVIRDIVSGKIKDFQPNLKTRFVFQIFYQMSVRFLQNLKIIDKKNKEIEKQLHKSMRNKELIQLLDLEKSLVYFSTSLNANQKTLQRLSRGKILTLYEDDEDLLEDVLIELQQATEMSRIYSDILSGTMDAFASLISNNLNIVMKFLTAITIVMSIPNIISGFYGMNVDLPMGFPFNSYLFPLSIMVIVMGTVIYWMHKKDMF